MKQFIRPAIAGLSLFAVVSCDDHSVGEEHHHHLEPVAVALVNADTDKTEAILFDPDHLPDSTDRKQLSLDKGSQLDLKVVLWCEHDGALEHCEGIEHNHDDHAEETHEEETHEEYSLSATNSNENVLGLTVDKHHFSLKVEALSNGESDLNVFILHGDHADISDKIFSFSVK